MSFPHVESWIQFLSVTGKSESTIRIYQSLARKWERYCQEIGGTVATATRATVLSWVGTEKAAGRLTNGTVRGHMTILSSFYRWAVEEGICPKNPLQNLSLPPANPRQVRSLSDDLVARLLASPPAWTPKGARDSLILYLGLESGIRISELADLRVSDIDIGTSSLFVRNGKGGKSRHAFFGDGAASALAKWLPLRERMVPDHEHLLCSGSQPHGPMTPDSLSRVFRRYSEMLADAPEQYASGRSLRHIRAHALRHTFATRTLAVTGDLEVVREQLGHGSLETTQIYIGATDRRRSQAIRESAQAIRLDSPARPNFLPLPTTPLALAANWR